ncbi:MULTISPECIES: DsbA family protein [Bifidobacterium]|jgi:protein-disulfide isomerase|uniref:Disulfide bond formation protein DsbA n=1 Tax=Bifidobacterium tibiigranuli TaxID=2172043 RepID=A0A5N6S9Z3_9BIFI|nr:thioredoxin domain-containing protein [Bifidobacterium tibiigranuli]KAE8129599.1 disulfide bond formation protein DsbA [Bifidobacterium tibiigranuli]KAE8129964.1 disulfide bond formation protein DsbA [Bifidobacterium tibiigranuli]MCI1212118.1 thioredoxin domain-containing protein [Bifidobacterium tibiigranuli]MCI1253981.1 thioredoxin domain-containing protein [Bifidobacterium tibiigranuli]MCI1792146.1 thioredoxin domain-containing protein [Bifidobacterium tibiigranuli]
MAGTNSQDNRNKAAKRQARADRQAATAAAQQAQAEQAAKERRQQTIIGAVVVAIVVVLIAVIGIVVYHNVHKSNATKNLTVQDAYSQLQNVKSTPKGANDKGGFLISKDGYGKKVAGVPTVGEYFDPLCPGCANFNREVDPTLKSLMDAGQINLELYPMSFLDGSSTDQYSSRASGAIAYIAGHDDNPDHLVSFIASIYAANFQPEEGQNYKPVSDAALKEQALKAGVPESVASKAFGREYQDWLSAINTYTPKRPELWNTEGQNKGAMTTPTVTFNGTTLDMTKVSSLGMDLKTAVLNSIGLTSSQVGKEGQLPSIGASGKPVSLG